VIGAHLKTATGKLGKLLAKNTGGVFWKGVLKNEIERRFV
jgi:hypothetical protein